MEPADSIRGVGFRKWYERQLLEGHAYLVTGILCAILVVVAIEYLDFHNAPARAGTLVAIMFAAGAITMVSIRRFLTILQRAEYYGNKSNCPKCTAYARFDVVSIDNRNAEEPVLKLHCRKCAAEWSMP